MAMYTAFELAEYMGAIRDQVCSRCIERPPGGPPCAPQGKRCGIEMHLPEIVEVVHRSRGRSMEPYIERFHNDVCAHCANRPTDQCPCPLDYLLLLAVEAIESVDAQRTNAEIAESLLA
jgi:hypothetical protein